MPHQPQHHFESLFLQCANMSDQLVIKTQTQETQRKPIIVDLSGQVISSNLGDIKRDMFN